MWWASALLLGVAVLGVVALTVGTATGWLSIQTVPTARLVDRIGQRRAMIPLSVLFVVGAVLVMWTAMTKGPEWLLWVGVAVSSISGPVGSLTRARWSHILRNDEIHTAFALEGALDEVLFIGGPALATILATVVWPPLGLIVCTLALIVEATLKLALRPHAQAGLRVLYRDAATAAAAVSRIMARPTTPTMLEFMDRSAIALIRRNGSDVPEAGAMLLVEADGDDDTLPYALQALADVAEGDGMIALDVATDGSARDRLWAARRALSPALRTIRPGKINEDVVVPVSRIPDLVAAMEALSLEAGLPVVVFGHAGNGNLHVNIMYDDADAAETARAHAALPRVFAQVLALGGTLSGEHGIGLSKRDFMADAFSAATLDAMHAVKAALDPDGILNPGKVLPPREPL